MELANFELQKQRPIATGERTTVSYDIGSAIKIGRVELTPRTQYTLTVRELTSDLSINGRVSVKRTTFDVPWQQLPGPQRGPVRDIQVSAADTDWIYATTQMSGMFVTSDGGQSWYQGPIKFASRQQRQRTMRRTADYRPCRLR